MVSVPTPLDPTAGDKLSATTFDAGVRDPLNFLMDGFPRVHAWDTTGNVCVIGVAKLILFDAETYDTDNMHDPVTNNSRITFTTAGRYDVNIMITMPAIGAYTQMDLNIRLNSGGSSAGGSSLRSQPYSDTIQAMPTIIFPFKRVFVATDYIEVFLTQSSSANRTTAPTSLATRVFAERLSAT